MTDLGAHGIVGKPGRPHPLPPPLRGEGVGGGVRADSLRSTLEGVYTRRRFLASALLATGAAGLAGCTLVVPTPSPATPTAAPAQSASDLAIGIVLSLTGRYSREGALLRAGYEVWADAVRQAGGIKVGSGRRAVRLVYADDESEPLNAGRQTERLGQSSASASGL